MKAKSFIRKLEDLCVQLDGWDAPNGGKWIAVLATWIDTSSGRLLWRLLEFAVTENQTAEQLNLIIQSALSDPHAQKPLLERTVACLGDGASNMVATAALLNKPKIWCFCHQMNVAVEAVFDAKKHPELAPIAAVLRKARRFARSCHSSAVLMRLYHQAQEQFGLKCVTPPCDVVTRWGSWFYLLRHVKDNLQAVGRTIELAANSTSRAQVEQCAFSDVDVKVLRWLVNTFDAPLGQLNFYLKYPNIASISTVPQGVVRLFTSVSTSVGDPTTPCERAKQVCMDKILDIWAQARKNAESIYLIAWALDPRRMFQGLGREPREKVLGRDWDARATAVLFKEMEVCLREPTVFTAALPMVRKQSKQLPPHVREAQRLAAGGAFTTAPEDDAAAENEDVTVQDIIHHEWATFNSERDTTAEKVKVLPATNPYKWWFARRLKMPTMYRIFRRYFSIPASSLLAERTFSQAGRVLGRDRYSLNRDTFAAIVIQKVNVNLKDETDFLAKKAEDDRPHLDADNVPDLWTEQEHYMFAHNQE